MAKASDLKKIKVPRKITVNRISWRKLNVIGTPVEPSFKSEKSTKSAGSISARFVLNISLKLIFLRASRMPKLLKYEISIQGGVGSHHRPAQHDGEEIKKSDLWVARFKYL